MNGYVIFYYKNKVLAEAIETRLLELGWKYAKNYQLISLFDRNCDGFCISVNDGQWTGLITPWTGCASKNYPEGNIKTLFTSEDYKSPTMSVKVKLNAEYSAAVFKDKVVVGCQTFSSEKIDELAKALNKLQN